MNVSDVTTPKTLNNNSIFLNVTGTEGVNHEL